MSRRIVRPNDEYDASDDGGELGDVFAPIVHVVPPVVHVVPPIVLAVERVKEPLPVGI